MIHIFQRYLGTQIGIVALWLFMSSAQAVDYAGVNATVTQLQVWSSGSDQYGIRVLASTYPAGCGAFYIPHTAANKSFIYNQSSWVLR